MVGTSCERLTKLVSYVDKMKKYDFSGRVNHKSWIHYQSPNS